MVGSNWGRPTHPAWSANLQAAETVRVLRHNMWYEAEVHEIVGAEHSEAWSSILKAWPNYELAQEMVPDRRFRIFALALEPT